MMKVLCVEKNKSQGWKEESKDWREDLNRHFFIEEVMGIPNEHLKGCSVLPVIREMEIKTTMTFQWLKL